MSQLQEDLWPADIVATPKTTVLGVLKIQASILGSKTSGFVDAEVRSFVEKNWMNHQFELVIPMMDSYHFPLFRVARQIGVEWPVDIWPPVGEKLKAENEEQFKDHLKAILSSERVKTIIQSFVDVYVDEDKVEPEPVAH